MISTENVAVRPLVHNVTLTDCEEFDLHVSDAILEDVVVDGLRVRDLLILADCSYKHVVLRGRLGSIKITSGFAKVVRSRPKMQAELDRQNNACYASIDWALDISAAEFVDFDVHGIPLSLIRRDVETQVILPAAVALSGQWREVPEFAKVWGPIVKALLQVGRGPDLLLVAGKRNRDFRSELSAINAARAAGLVS